jgi:hypothetical protein
MSFFDEHTNRIDIFSSPSEPISPYLWCCGGFAVDDHSFTRRAYHLRQTRLVNYPGHIYISRYIDIVKRFLRFFLSIM